MNSIQSDTPVKTLIILLNMGGPQNKEEIHPYLKELFQDRELLKLPFQKVLGRFIAWRRTPKIQERYEEIGQYSPTKTIMENQCVEIAKKLEQAALSDPYFADRKLYPNVDFYSGIIYRAMGISTETFTVMFALGRLPGWIAQWREMRLNKEPIGRPRQIYVGHNQRPFVPLNKR